MLDGTLVRPRVDTHPPYEKTYGPLAVDLAAVAGLRLDGWQADALDIMLAFDPVTRKYVCFEHCEIVSRQNGKGAILEARALTGLLLLGEELIMWSAHEVKTALEGFRRCLKLVKRLGTKVNPKDDNLWEIDGRLIKVSHQNSEEGFELLDTGARLRFIARSKSSGRGFSGDVNIIDEAFAYTHVQHEALLPTVSARPNGQFIYTSSPPLDGESGEVLYQLRHRGDPSVERDADAEPWQQDAELAFRDWGLAGDLDSLDKVDLDDEQNWKTTNPSLGASRLTIEKIRRERRSMSKAGFARERLGIWPRRIGTAGGVIDAQLWAQMTDESSRRHGDIALAVDVTPLRDHASISMYGLREDGIGHVQVVTYGAGVDWVVRKLLELKAALDPVAIGLDPKGGAAALLGELKTAGITPPEDPEYPARGDLAMPAVHEVAQGVGQFIDACRQKQLRHVGQGELNLAVANARTRPLADAIAWGRKQSDVDISPLVSATMARWAYTTRIDVIGNNKIVELTGALMA